MTTNFFQMLRPQRTGACVIALHCSLGSGRQWTKLGAELGNRYQFIAPDLSGYGDRRAAFELPTTLAKEVELLANRLAGAVGPIHLVGHSYGGAVAFKIATDSPLASRVRSLTLIEPVLPTLLADNAADLRLHDRFACVARNVCEDIWNGRVMEAIDKFTGFWNGSAPREQPSANARLRMIEQAYKLAFDFTSAFAERDVAAKAASLRVPTLLFSGGLSPYLTQRIVQRFGAIIDGAERRHLPAAGHMLPMSHAAEINAAIVRHIACADEFAGVPPAAAQPMAEVISLAKG
jgi:pimeloyl-ACP methyl ester carboxylesterase